MAANTGKSLLETLEAATLGLGDRLRSDHVEDARDFEDRQRFEREAIHNRTDSSGKHVVLDERHEIEQDAIAGGKRLASGDYEIEILRCYSVDGDPEIWLPEVDVGYFVCEMSAWSETKGSPEFGAWVNRLRFGGMAQLKAFVIEAKGLGPNEHGLVNGPLLARVVSPENPLKGVRLSLRVQPPTRSGYKHHQWRRLGG